jgi:hypothetical protein
MKMYPVLRKAPHREDVWGMDISFLISALDGGKWSGSRPGRLVAGERAPGTHWIGGWVGPRAGLEAATKRKSPSPCWKSNLGRLARSLVAIPTELPRLHVTFQERKISVRTGVAVGSKSPELQ